MFGAIIAAVLIGGCSSATPSGSGTTVVHTAPSPTTAAVPSATTPTTLAATTTTAAATTTTRPVDVSTTAYGKELANLNPDGTRSLDSARKLFALAVAPLPGVDASTDRTGVRSGTLALKNILAHYAELTPEQKAAVDAARVPPQGVEKTIVPVGFVRPEKTPLNDAIVAATKQSRDQISAKLGPLPGAITVVVGTLANLYGQADPDFTSGTYGGCTLTIDAINNTNPSLILNTVTHEVFHCFQAAAANSEAVWEDTGDWMIEGSAEWAAAILTPSPVDEAEWWKEYLTEVQVPLFTRTYQAIGFFSHLAESGTDPWSVFKKVFAADGSEAEFDASGANGDAFMSSWSSGFFRDPSRGAAWDTTGPGITGDKSTPITVPVANGDNKAFSAEPYSTAENQLAITADVVIMQGSGFARLNDKATDIPMLTASTFCTKTGGCGTCPDGTPLPDNPPPLATDPLLAVSSNAKQSSGTIVGLSVMDYCKDHQKVWVRFVRPASNGVLTGNIVELYGCKGPFGVWQGVFRSGGLDTNGFVVPFAELPVSFAFSGSGAQTVHTAANGNVAAPTGNITVSLELDISIDEAGSTMSITGTGTAATSLISVSDYLGSAADALPIEPAPDGSCQ